jgi:hypothetical protein
MAPRSVAKKGTILTNRRSKASNHFFQDIMEENAMKALLSSVALAVALAVTGPAFAGDVTTAKTQADCEKAGGTWDAATSKCAEKKM